MLPKSAITSPANIPDSQIWRVRLNRRGRDSTLTVVVERNAAGRFQIAALNDMGGTLFQATTADDGSQVTVQHNHIRMPDHVLAHTFIHDALLGFLTHPPDAIEQQVLRNGRCALLSHLPGNRAWVYLIDDNDGSLYEFLCLWHHSITYRAQFNTPGQPFKGGYKITSYWPRYIAVYSPMNP